jgi:hypothetical protein
MDEPGCPLSSPPRRVRPANTQKLQPTHSTPDESQWENSLRRRNSKTLKKGAASAGPQQDEKLGISCLGGSGRLQPPEEYPSIQCGFSRGFLHQIANLTMSAVRGTASTGPLHLTTISSAALLPVPGHWPTHRYSPEFEERHAILDSRLCRLPWGGRPSESNSLCGSLPRSVRLRTLFLNCGHMHTILGSLNNSFQEAS